MTSGPFWAILVAHTCNNFGWYMLLVELPTYMAAILRFNISQVSLHEHDNQILNFTKIYPNRMLGCQPFRICHCGFSASFGVTDWIGLKERVGFQQQLYENFRQPSVSYNLFHQLQLMGFEYLFDNQHLFCLLLVSLA